MAILTATVIHCIIRLWPKGEREQRLINHSNTFGPPSSFKIREERFTCSNLSGQVIVFAQTRGLQWVLFHNRAEQCLSPHQSNYVAQGLILQCPLFQGTWTYSCPSSEGCCVLPCTLYWSVLNTLWSLIRATIAWNYSLDMHAILLFEVSCAQPSRLTCIKTVIDKVWPWRYPVHGPHKVAYFFNCIHQDVINV